MVSGDTTGSGETREGQRREAERSLAESESGSSGSEEQRVVGGHEEARPEQGQERQQGGQVPGQEEHRSLDLNENVRLKPQGGRVEAEILSQENKCNRKKVKKGIFNKKATNKAGKQYTMNFFSTNVRGLQSKVDTFSNILVKNEVDVALVSETHNQGEKNIKVEGYVCYYRNRVGREKGGVAMYIKEKWANGCMKLESGIDNNEFFVLRMENSEPNVIVIVYYGVIEKQFLADEVSAMQSDLFDTVRKYVREGNRVIWAGDFNNHLADSLGLMNNPGEVSPGGKNLAGFIESENLSLLNTRDMNHTHYDRTAGTSKILDLVITNVPDKVKNFRVDKDLEFTPYRIKQNKDGHFKVHTDHVGIMWQLEVEGNSNVSNKKVMWNYNKKDGGYKYEQSTNEKANEINDFMDQCEDIEIIAEFILNKVDEAKKEAYGKTTKTKSQLKRFSDAIIWRKRSKDIEKAIEGVGREKVRTNDKIWLMRNKLSDKFTDNQFVGIQNPVNGEMTRTRDETFQVTLDYNYELLRKDKDDEDVPEEVTAIREAKRVAIQMAMESKEFVEDEELSYNDFKRVLKKIKAQNKQVYRDLILAGEEFQMCVFRFYNLCYKLEIMPEFFSETELRKLYKGKGNRVTMKANRFLHLKGWFAKTYEKMLMTKVEDKLFANTPDFQVGGQKQGSTNEHLLSMILSMRKLESEKGAGAVIFMDIMSCFDRVRLDDILFETVQAGVIGRPLINIRDYTDKLVIKMQGDTNPNRKAMISNSTGQGTSFAPVGTSLLMSKSLDVKVKQKSDEEQKQMESVVGGVKMRKNFFVDDLAKINENVKEILLNCQVITESLDELGLKAHPDKSGLLVFGPEREKFKEEIRAEQPKVQKFELSFKKCETYLGMAFDENGAEESITKTILVRKGKCIAKAADINRKLSDEKMMGVGWLAGAVLLHSSIIMSTLTYGAAAFTGMTDKQWLSLETIQYHCLLHILGISTKTTYNSLLYVLGLLPAQDVVKKLQISFVNSLIHLKGSGQCLEALWEEDRSGTRGLLAEVREYCAHYGLQDVTKYYVPHNVIKETIESRVLNIMYIKHLEAKKPPPGERRVDCRVRFYSTLPKNQAKLYLCFEVGDLNFRRSRKQEALKRYGSFQCLVPFCNEDDSYEHVRKCPGYSSQLLKDDPEPNEIISFLTCLEEERNKKFKRSLINFRTL